MVIRNKQNLPGSCTGYLAEAIAVPIQKRSSNSVILHIFQVSSELTPYPKQINGEINVTMTEQLPRIIQKKRQSEYWQIEFDSRKQELARGVISSKILESESKGFVINKSTSVNYHFMRVFRHSSMSEKTRPALRNRPK